MLASLLATIVTPANVIGLPVGIWALVVLFSERVRAAFRAASPKWNKPQPQTTPLAR